ncbi:Methyltransferase type 11 [Niveomyces insectorum RCEF 264]|uniref:Methyltransferase type 11 n=1 Tax=Niveomyces insectorum RCEF 264 TaxID=1081102 RepID=A0A167XRL5_9HYPO|nr:Methyltransferase type 11 [Niveomyces insectorum RCEF 264]
MAENDEVLSRAEFWDERYAKTDGEAPTHEWFRSFDDLEEFFQKVLFQSAGRRPDDNPLILHLGSGDSEVPAEFHMRGYRRQICVDFSAKAVEIMSERYKSRPEILWVEMDVRDMKGIADRSVDVAFDKGTFDAMIHGSPWSPPPDVRDNTSRYLKEVHRVLKDHGVFIYVTFRQPHFMRPLLDAPGLWSLDLEVLGGKGGAFDYYGWILQKKTRREQTPRNGDNGRENNWHYALREARRANGAGRLTWEKRKRPQMREVTVAALFTFAVCIARM